MKLSQVNRRALCRLAAIGLVLVLGCMAANAQINALYLESNIGNVENMNSVYGYSIDTTTGDLTALPGSPYLSGGTGIYNPTQTGLAFDLDDEVIVNPEKTLLFAVNMHSNNVSVYQINSDGTLTLAPGSPVASGGQEPGSLALLDNPAGQSLLTVVNHDQDAGQTQIGPNLATFQVDNVTGALTPTGTTIPLPLGSAPSQAIVGKAKLEFVDMFMNSSINLYRMKASGAMTLLATAGNPSGNPILGLRHHPTQAVIYAAMPGDIAIGIYRYAPVSGQLKYIKSVPDPGMAVCWLTINAAGTVLYAGESVSQTITVFNIANPANPIQVQHVTLMPGGNAGLTNLALDPTEHWLYGSKGNTLHIFAVNPTDGTLTESHAPFSLPQPTGEIAQGLVTISK